jgi:hypothetical protein
LHRERKKRRDFKVSLRIGRFFYRRASPKNSTIFSRIGTDVVDSNHGDKKEREYLELQNKKKLKKNNLTIPLGKQLLEWDFFGATTLRIMTVDITTFSITIQQDTQPDDTN